MSDSRHYTWQTVRGYIKLVFRGLEQDSLTWRDSEGLRKIGDRVIGLGERLQSSSQDCNVCANKCAGFDQCNISTEASATPPESKYSQSSSSKAVTSCSSKTTSKAKTFIHCCQDFNQGMCTYNGSHSSDHGFVKHKCSYCFNSRHKQFSHAEVVCQQKEGVFRTGFSQTSQCKVHQK